MRTTLVSRLPSVAHRCPRSHFHRLLKKKRNAKQTLESDLKIEESFRLRDDL